MHNNLHCTITSNESLSLGLIGKSTNLKGRDLYSTEGMYNHNFALEDQSILCYIHHRVQQRCNNAT